MKVIAFIPVRGGSKSIPLKNIKSLAGKPLVCYAIDAALQCKWFDEVVISTDSDAIREVVKKQYSGNARVQLFNRSAESATDTATTESAMLEYARAATFDHIVLMQATSPLVSANDLNNGLGLYFDRKAGGLVTVVRQKRFLWETEGAYAKPTNYQYTARPRRQDFDGFFVENGAFYATSREALLKSNCRISEPVVMWEMREETFVELDEPHDWLAVEMLLAHAPAHSKDDVLKKAKSIKLFLTDVDGVLTDAGMYYSEQGEELKKFNTRDGKGFELLRAAGIKTGIITSENTTLVERRAKKIKADFLFQGALDKASVLQQILSTTGLSADEVAYIGDDVNDLSIIAKAGLSACPADAVPAIQQQVDLVLKTKGGFGCVREFVELILENR